jgi:SPP1 family predicted phage head-tail adaptor
MPGSFTPSGDLRNRLLVQSSATAPNVEGEPIDVWTTVATRWGKVEPLSAHEQFVAVQTQSLATHKVTIRYYAGLDPSMRFQFGTRVFQIESIVSTDAIKTEQVCMVIERVSRVVLIFRGLQSNVPPGIPFGFTVAAMDQFNALLVGYTGTVGFTSSDSLAGLPAAATLTSGLGSFSSTLRTAGNQTITATDSASAAIYGASSALNVGGFTSPVRFIIGLTTNTPTAGVGTTVSVFAIQGSGATATGYTGTVAMTSTDPAAILPAPATLLSGVGTFSVTLKTAGKQTLTVTDSASPLVAGRSQYLLVLAAALSQFSLSSPAATTAGSLFTFTVTALDQFGNLQPGFGGTVSFSSSDTLATLPAASFVFLGRGTFSATLSTAGTQQLTAIDTAATSITGNSGPISVTAGTATHFSVSAPASATGGVGIDLTVTALDGFNNTAVGYAGTASFASTDAQAVLSANTPLLAGTGILSLSATLITAGNQTLTATDTVNVNITGKTARIVVAASNATSHFAVTCGTAVNAGTALVVTVIALDVFNHKVSGYAGTVLFSSGDIAGILPIPSTLTNGSGIFSATLGTPGARVITCVDNQSPSISGASSSIAVNGPAFYVAFFWDNANTSSEHLGKSAGGVIYDPIAITWSLPYTPHVFRDQSGVNMNGRWFTFADTGDTVALPNYFAILTTDGQRDASGKQIWYPVGNGKINLAPYLTGVLGAYNPRLFQDFSGNWWLSFVATLSDFNHNLPYVMPLLDPTNLNTGWGNAVAMTGAGNFSFPAGMSDLYVWPLNNVFYAFYEVTGTQDILLASSASVSSGYATLQGSQWLIPAGWSTVSPHLKIGGLAYRFNLDGIAVAGKNNEFYVEQTIGAGDFTSGVAPSGGYAITSPAAINTPLDGVAIIRSMDPIVIPGNATAGAATHFLLTGTGVTGNGRSMPFTVYAEDASNFVATSYAGTINFTSSDGGAVLPAASALAYGVGIFSVTLNTTGSQTITATDSVTGSIVGTLTVTNMVTSQFAVTAPATVTAGVAFNVTVTAEDISAALVAGYTGTVGLTIGVQSTPATLPPAATLTNGVGLFSVTVYGNSGGLPITASDTLAASVTGTVSPAVTGGVATHFALTRQTPVPINTICKFTVTAKDSFNNSTAAYAGTVGFTASDTGVTLPANSVLTNGVGNFSATFVTPGGQTITATDTVATSIAGASPNIVVSGPATHFKIAIAAASTTGVLLKLTVTAQDLNNNTATAYAGTVHLTSSDSSAILGPNKTITSGVGTFSSTLQTAGTQSISASDTVTGSITGTASVSAVASGSTASHFVLTMNSQTQNFNSPFNITVTAKDGSGNTVTAYAGNATLSAINTNGETNASLTWSGGGFPADSMGNGGPFVNGVFVFTAVAGFAGGGSYCQFQCTDDSNPAITGVSQIVTFN